MKNALIFDADPVSSAHIAGTFANQGYETTVCGLYDDAIRHASDGTYRSVACHMHDTEEIQLVRRLRTMQPDAMMFVFSTPEIIASNAVTLGEDAHAVSVYRGPKTE